MRNIKRAVTIALCLVTLMLLTGCSNATTNNNTDISILGVTFGKAPTSVSAFTESSSVTDMFGSDCLVLHTEGWDASEAGYSDGVHEWNTYTVDTNSEILSGAVYTDTNNEWIYLIYFRGEGPTPLDDLNICVGDVSLQGNCREAVLNALGEPYSGGAYSGWNYNGVEYYRYMWCVNGSDSPNLTITVYPSGAFYTFLYKVPMHSWDKQVSSGGN